MRRLLTAITAFGIAFFAWTDVGRAAETAVQANNFRFCDANSPTCTPFDAGYSVTVPQGSTVTWTYNDPECDVIVPCPGHNVTFADGTAGETMKESGAVLLTRRFDTPGEYEYVCTIHEAFDMTGKVVVEAAAAAPDTPTGGGESAPPVGAAPGDSAPTTPTLPTTGSSSAQLVVGISLGAAGLARWLMRRALAD